MDFLRWRLRQNSTVVMSFCVQQVHVGWGYCEELSSGRGSVPGVESVGVKREIWSPFETQLRQSPGTFRDINTKLIFEYWMGSFGQQHWLSSILGFCYVTMFACFYATHLLAACKMISQWCYLVWSPRQKIQVYTTAKHLQLITKISIHIWETLTWK